MKFAITPEAALTLPRFTFIAHYLVVRTRQAKNLGPLKERVLYAKGVYRVLQGSSRIEVYSTPDPSLLFDYVRRTQLGTLVREAEHYRIAAYEEWDAAATPEYQAKKTAAELERDIRRELAKEWRG